MRIPKGAALIRERYLFEARRLLEELWYTNNFFLKKQLQKQKYDLNKVANYLFKVNNGNTKARCGISSKLTIKIQEQHHHPFSGNKWDCQYPKTKIKVLTLLLMLV